jgi:hypothetical protein
MRAMKASCTFKSPIERGYNVASKKPGWYIINPNETKCLKATRVSTFKDKDHDYVVFRILRKKDRE